MKRGLNLRQKVFWLNDALKRSRLKKQLNDTEATLGNTKTQKTNVDTCLQSLIKHAVSTTEYYKNISANNNLQDFPVINKNNIRNNLNAFIASTIDVSECKKVSTSGSTGAPFSTYQNKSKVLKNVADNIYFSSKSNYNIGDFLVYIKIWPDTFTLKKSMDLKMKNIQPLSVFNLADTQIEGFISKLNKQSSNISFIGYASSFEKICKYIDKLEKNPIKFKTKSIITISEALNDYTRKSINTYFGINPLSRYSNNENGIIAQQIDVNDSRFKINNSSYVVEVFDLNSDKKLDYGERGRIVITDLYNYATPLIRYDTGDVGTIVLGAGQNQYFTEVSGRKLDLLYNTKGNLLPSHLSAKLCKYGDYKQFQLVQKGLKEYEINLNTDKRVDEEQLQIEYKGYFGEDSTIRINYVDDIPLLNSGKRREVVNEYYK